jgi:hypothetical protein
VAKDFSDAIVHFRNTANGCNQRLATLREPHRRILSRVRCIALFCSHATTLKRQEPKDSKRRERNPGNR